MPIFFKNPILGRLEDILLEKAMVEVEKQLTDKDPKVLYKEARDITKAWLSQERPKVKLASKTYKTIAKEKTSDALAIRLGVTKPSCYSVEIVDRIETPIVLVVPIDVLKYTVVITLAKHLENRIEFKKLMDSSRLAFAQEAVEIYFLGIIKESKKKGTKFNIGLPYGHQATIVDIIKADWYYLGDEDNSSQVNTIVFSSNDEKWWKAKNEDVDFRPQGRQFSEEALRCWGLKSPYFQKIKIR